MSAKKGGLGKGISALLTDYEVNVKPDEEITQQKVVELPLNQITPNPDQPRKRFDEDKMMDLTESVKKIGVLQPILVRPFETDRYMIVAGERRWRAARAAGMDTIPAIIKEMDYQEMMELAVIENIQRDDLTPVEEARAYVLLEKVCNYTQEDVAEKIGKSRSAVANITRILSLPEEVLDMIDEGMLTVGHVRPLLAIDVPDWQIAFSHEIYQSKLSVREVERIVQKLLAEGVLRYDTTEVLFQKQRKRMKLDPQMRILQDQLAEHFSTKVSIKSNGRKGKLVIEFTGEEDLKRILDTMQAEIY